MERLTIDGKNLLVAPLTAWTFQRGTRACTIPDETFARIEHSHRALLSLLESDIPIYGVTTGFGDSGNRIISRAQTEELQHNLVQYLLCGSGPVLPVEVSRAILTIRINSLCRGHSGVSRALIERLQLHLENDWIPVIPREGSLGASGDLIPLAYLAQNISGEGQVFAGDRLCQMRDVLQERGLEPYRFRAKEALAIVNGTSAMAGQFTVNLNHARFLLDWLSLNTSWLCLALNGRTEAFGTLVNEQAKASRGQTEIAKRVRTYLEAENYRSKPLNQIHVSDAQTAEWVQDRYSLRCVPQILGPVHDTLTLIEGWLLEEINSASDNPLIGDELASGGNFYGGYLSQGMDYLKISLAHMADTIDRQVAYIIDDKSNRGLPANLANWKGLPKDEKHLHHGLKGLHQSVSAITSEILARATPGGIFSRSSESHNQDKVSLGMSTAVQCAEMLEPLFTILTLQSVVLAQALDLRERRLEGATSSHIYRLIRTHVPFVERDQALGDKVSSLRAAFKDLSAREGRI